MADVLALGVLALSTILGNGIDNAFSDLAQCAMRLRLACTAGPRARAALPVSAPKIVERRTGGQHIDEF
jgi:hypothetical protein